MTDLTGGAVELAKNFVKTTYTDNSKTVGVTSTLVYGVQWDATMQFFDNTYIKGTPSTTSYVRDSTGKGNYSSSSKINTGSNENYKVKNIYDIAGNVMEWTMKAYFTYLRVSRGGDYTDDGSHTPASNRIFNYEPALSGDIIGFRLALYVNV